MTTKLEELVVGGLLLVMSKPVGRPLVLGLGGVTWVATKAVAWWTGEDS